MAFGGREPPVNQIDLRFGRRDPLLRLLLKRMEHVHETMETDGVDGPPGVSVEWRDDLHDGVAAEALQRFGGGIGLSPLRRVEGEAHIEPDFGGKAPQVFLCRPHPAHRFEVLVHNTSIRLL